jgi:hypothetical protein
LTQGAAQRNFYSYVQNTNTSSKAYKFEAHRWATGGGPGASHAEGVTTISSAAALSRQERAISTRPKTHGDQSLDEKLQR